MSKARTVLFCLLMSVAATALASGDHEHDSGGATVAVTRWSESMELFMEYPAMAAGETGQFVVHLTVLDGFQPVRAGHLTLRFRGPAGNREFSVSELLRDGIFAPEVSLAGAGDYALEIEYEGPETTSRFTIEEVVVHPTREAVPDHPETEATGEIGFLKEQQWRLPFATAEAESREIKRAVWAIGEVLPATTGYVEIVAPVDGIVQATHPGDLALPGSRVARGDVVAKIMPPLTGDGWAESQLAFAQAERNLERARRLRERGAISEREFEEARNEFLRRKAGHDRLAGSGDGDLLRLTAPIDGKIIDWQVRPGQSLAAGDKLMAVADASVVWLKVNVYERDFRTLGTPVGAYVDSGGEQGGWEIGGDLMRVLTSAGALDPATRTIPILLEIDNAEGRLTINELTPVELFASDGESAVAVPRSAVFEDEGMDVVFVQVGGESFTKKIVVRGPRQGDWVSIVRGLEAGERVVTRGGYQVKLAASSAEIGHGHAH